MLTEVSIAVEILPEVDGILEDLIPEFGGVVPRDGM